MTGKVLIIDDDASSRVRVAETLLARGYHVRDGECGDASRAMVDHWRPDLIVVNPSALGAEGWRGFRRLRQDARVPCIVITDNRTIDHRVQALRYGADDVLSKPFSAEELELRIRATLRRMRARTTLVPPEYDDGVLRIDLEQQRVELDGQEVRLSPTEFRLLRCLLVRRGHVVPHRHILYQVWGSTDTVSTENLTHFVHTLRSKLERDPSKPRYIRTHWGAGYRFDHTSSSSERCR